MNSVNKKIAFFRTERWPYANVKLAQVLQDELPEYKIATIDVYERIKSNPRIVAKNTLEILKMYGPEILARKKRFKRCFWRTPYIFLQMRQLIQEILQEDTYACSFQIQSLFDASTHGLPHFVYTDHTHLANLSYPGFDTSDLYSQEWIDLERTIYSHASINFVCSSNIAESLIDDYQCPPSKVVCAYIGSNAVDKALPVDPAKYSRKHILFVGIDWERKGGPDLIEAFRLVRLVEPNACLTIVGCSPSIDLPNCRVVGRVPVEAVGQYFQEASVFCLPTRLEPFGIVFVEAMASKLPIVATNVGAIPDLVRNGETGFLVQPGDVQGIAAALIELISDPDQSRTFGERGFARAGDLYSWKSVGNIISQHIQEHLHTISN